MEKQKTINQAVSLSGIGIHSGDKVNIKFLPAPENAGINFIRVDLPKQPVIKAGIENVLMLSNHNSLRHTSLEKEGVRIKTIEHLMAALYGLEIDNIYIEIDGEEVPALDGSGQEFYNALMKAGIKQQDCLRKIFIIKEPLWIEENGATLAALPCSEFKISYTLSYNHPLLKSQFLSLYITPDAFYKELAGARTFCLEEEANGLLEKGLGKGADYSNTLVVGKEGVIGNKLRFEDEFVRHKILDLVGDLYLLGMPIKGHFVALRSGHYLNIKILDKIKSQSERYSKAGVMAQEINISGKKELNRQEIMQILPHRDPFLFVDKILHLEEGKRVIGVKYLTQEDYFFKGHFPGKPIMPGVLIIEAMAQVGGVMMLILPENRGKLAYFLSCNNAKFRKTVLPGDTLVLEVETLKLKSRTGAVKAAAYVEGNLVAEAELVFALSDS